MRYMPAYIIYEWANDLFHIWSLILRPLALAYKLYTYQSENEYYEYKSIRYVDSNSRTESYYGERNKRRGDSLHFLI